jgi:hypothetical protein
MKDIVDESKRGKLDRPIAGVIEEDRRRGRYIK